MRILHVVAAFPPAWRSGGPVVVAHGLARALAAAGHDVSVFAGNRDGRERLEVPLCKEVDVDGIRTRYFPLHGRFGYAPALARALRRETAAFDLVHIHSLFRWHTLVASREARRADVPYLLRPAGALSPACMAKSYAGAFVSIASRLKKRLYLATLGRGEIAGAAGMHFMSEEERAGAASLHLPCPGFVVPPGIDPAPPRLEVRRGTPAIAILARLDPIKGFDQLLPALALLRGAFTLLVAGKGEPAYEAFLRSEVERLRIGDRVRFLGGVTGSAKSEFLASADLFVLPSHHENFGLSVLEAMAAGLPVVVSDRVALAETVTREATGIVVERRPEALAAALQRLIDDPVLRRTMGEQGARVAGRDFSWDSAARRMEAVYAEVSQSAVSRTPSPRSKGLAPQSARVGSRS